MDSRCRHNYLVFHFRGMPLMIHVKCDGFRFFCFTVKTDEELGWYSNLIC